MGASVTWAEGWGEGHIIVQSLSHVRLSVTPWTMACQVLLSMGFFRQEYWSGLPFPSPGGHISRVVKHVGKGVQWLGVRSQLIV